MICPNCGKELSDLAAVCINCGTSLKSADDKKSAQPDKRSFILCAVAFFVPIFGFIFWATNSSITPKKAKACGIWAIIGSIAAVIVPIISYLITLLFSLYRYYGYYEDIAEYSEYIFFNIFR